MAQKSSRQRRAQLEVELLETRLAPATLPLIQNTLQVLGTYGQYQDISPGRNQPQFDNNIHLHEGLDLAEAASRPVRSVLNGVVDAVYKDPLTPSASFVVIRDTNGFQGAAQANGFNYKHTIPQPGLVVGAFVREAQQIGTVADFPALLPSHLHLDRGNNGAVGPAPGNILVARDPTIAALLLGPTGFNAVAAAAQNQIAMVQNAAVAAAQAKVVAAQGDFAQAQANFNAIKPNTPLAERQRRVQALAVANRALVIANAQLTTANFQLTVLNSKTLFRNALQWQFPSVMNPMSVLNTVPGVVDQTPPTINGIDYRLQVDDVLGRTRDIGALFGQLAEQPRTNSRYFRATLTVGGQTRPQLGRAAPATVFAGVTGVSTPVQRGNIDFVVNARDNFGPGQIVLRAVNPNLFDLNVTGAVFGATSGRQRSFDFSASPTYTGVGDFVNVGNTRAVYENDAQHNSGLLGPFFYNLTNSPNLNGAPIQGGMLAADSAYYWNSDAAQGQTFVSNANAANDVATNATSNANAAFPDDIYTIQVGATDFAGNRTARDFSVVLTNWARTVQTSAAVYKSGDTISVTGGDQFRANQAVGLHLIRAIGTATAPASGTTLDDGTLEATDTTNAAGQLTAANFIHAAVPGRYFVIADYNGDGQFTPFLDAFTVVTVQGASQSSLNTNPNPSTVGQNVTMTATVAAVAPATGIPTGTVTFFNGTTNLGTKPLIGGTATLAVTSLPVGTLQLQAVYSGSNLFTVSTGTANQTVNPAAPQKMNPQASLTPNPGPPVFGQPVTLSATIAALAPDTGTPTGTVLFFDGDTPLGSATLSSGTASITVSTLNAGTHNIVADYSGDNNFNFTSASASQAVNLGDTTVTVSATPSSVTLGQDLNVFVAVGSVNSANGTPTGAIELFEGSTSLGSAPLDNGSVNFTLSNFSAGAHALTAVYSGDSNFHSSRGETTDTILRLDTTTSGNTLPYSSDPTGPPAAALGDVSDPSPPPPSLAGQQILISAFVGSADDSVALPGGTVNFYNGATLLGTSSVVDGQASLVIDGLAAGSYTFTLSYSGDANCNPSTGTVNHNVIQGDSTTSLSTSPDPSAFGQAITLTATVSPIGAAAGTLTGSVEFYDSNSNLLGTSTLSGGTATLIVSNLAPHQADVFAIYTGDANFTSSVAFATHTMLNQAPVANNDSATTAALTPVVIHVLDNDQDGDNDPLIVTSVTAPAHGTAAINADGTVTYTPNSTLLTSDSFSYTIADAYGGTATATVTVTLDPPLASISINNVTHSEGNSGTTLYVFTVTLANPSSVSVSVNYTLVHGTTDSSDLTAVGGLVTFNPGETSKTIAVNVNGDTTFEPDDTFFVNLSSPTNATIANGQGLGTILNDDSQPQININSVSHVEGNSGTTAFVFTVSLSNPSYQTITLHWSTADGSATVANNDYVSASGTLTFLSGETSKTITVLVNGDTVFEPDENFFVNLTNGFNASIVIWHGQGTIQNDDTPGFP